jgi:ribosomal protein L1
VEFRVERQGIIMAGVGKLSFEDNKLKDNLRAFMIALSNAKPESMKGQYFRVRVCGVLVTAVTGFHRGLSSKF